MLPALCASSYIMAFDVQFESLSNCETFLDISKKVCTSFKFKAARNMADQQTATMPHIDSHNIAMLQAIGTLAGSKPVYEYSVPEQRELFNRLQSPRPQNPGVSISEHLIKTSHGEVKTFLYKPEGAEGALPFIFYVHGGGWIFGSAMDFETFLFDLVQRTGLAVVFPEYTLAPEKRHPTQIEQCVEVLQDVLEHGSTVGLRVDQIVVAADSVGCSFDIFLNYERNELIFLQVKWRQLYLSSIIKNPCSCQLRIKYFSIQSPILPRTSVPAYSGAQSGWSSSGQPTSQARESDPTSSLRPGL